MQFADYMIAAALGSLVIVASAFPLLVASVVAWWPGRRPRHKFAFVSASAIIVLGTAGLVSLLALPFELFGTYISPQLEYDGHRTVPIVVRWAFTATTWLSYLVIVGGAVSVPVVLRRWLWDRLREAITSENAAAASDE